MSYTCVQIFHVRGFEESNVHFTYNFEFVLSIYFSENNHKNLTFSSNNCIRIF